MVNSDTSARTHVQNAKGTVKHLDAVRRLTDDDIRVAISYREEDLDDEQYCAKVGVVILLIVIVIAFATLFSMLPPCESGLRKRDLACSQATAPQILGHDRSCCYCSQPPPRPL
jgi:hypothetical protein